MYPVTWRDASNVFGMKKHFFSRQQRGRMTSAKFPMELKQHQQPETN